jgi:hydroxypyruvate isomerase
MSSNEARRSRLIPCVCIDLVFNGWDTIKAIDAVAAAGIPAIEFWGWRGKDIDALAERARHHHLQIAAMSLDPAIRLLDGDAVAQFLESISESLTVARQIGCGRLVVHVQPVPMGSGPRRFPDPAQDQVLKTQRRNISAALKKAAPMAEASGVVLMLEPLNTLVDHRGYCLSCSGDGAEVLREVDSTAVKLLFDVYHMQISEGNLINNITANVDLLAHLHIADVPGRHEPGTGEINFLNVLTAARSAGYDGCVGMELIPTGDPLAAIRSTARMIELANGDIAPRGVHAVRGSGGRT